MTGLRSGRNVFDRRVVGAGVIFRNPDHGRGQGKADQRAAVQGAGRHARDVRHHPVGDRVEQDGGQYAGHDQSLVQGAHNRAALSGPDKETADHGGDDGSAAQRQRIEHGIFASLDYQAAQQHGRYHGHRIGFEQVGGHAGAIADVVADVIRDHRGVARVVLGDAGFHLADQVGAYVRALGEDAASQPGKNRNEGAAETQADQGMENGVGFRAQVLQQGIVAGDAQKTQSDDQ